VGRTFDSCQGRIIYSHKKKIRTAFPLILFGVPSKTRDKLWAARSIRARRDSLRSIKGNMKLITKILIFSGLIIVLLFLAAGIYFQRNGKALVEQAFYTTFNKRVHIGHIGYQFPLGVTVAKVDIDNFARIPSVSVQFSPEVIFNPSQIKIASVVFLKPLAVIEKFGSGKKEEGDAGISSLGQNLLEVQAPLNKEENERNREPLGEVQEDQKGLSVNIDRIIVKEGQLYFSQNSVEKDFSFKIENFGLETNNISFPVASTQTRFNFRGILVKKNLPFSGSHLQGQGWFNLAAKDMEGQLKVTGEDEQVGLSADVVSKNNDMTVKGNINMNNLLSKAMDSLGFQIGGTFMFKTKMDDFQLNDISFSGNVIKVGEEEDK